MLYDVKRSDFVDKYKLYVEDEAFWKPFCDKDYFIDVPVESKVIKNGVVIPVTSYDPMDGGIYDAEGNFVDRLSKVSGKCSKNVGKDISFENAVLMPHIHETVVYGGVIFNHYGHMIMESLTRLWWFLENQDSHYRIVFISPYNEILYKDFLLMLDLQEENIMLLKQAICFDAIIVPEQSYYIHGGYTSKAMMVFDKIRDSVAPAKHKKLYLTRSKLPIETGRIAYEEYFENYYRSKGYKIIAPEQHTIKEKISILSGAEDVVCCSGTLQHQVLFCQDSIKQTILPKTGRPYITEFWIIQARAINCTFIDVSINFLPAFTFGTALLFGPNHHWKQYVLEQNGKLPDDNGMLTVFSLESLKEYIDYWTKSFIRHFSYSEFYDFCATKSLADVIILMNEYFLGNKIDKAVKVKLYDAFTPKKYMLDTRLKTFCLHHQKVYIYGAGYVATYQAEAMNNQNINFEGFVISDGQKNARKIMEKKIHYLSEINDTESGIIIGLDNNNTNAVLPMLEEKGFKNVLILN